MAIVSFGYPPIRHVSGARASNMARQLHSIGHEVTVVTVDWRDPRAPRPRVSDEGGVRVIRIDPREWFPDFVPNGPPLSVEAPIQPASIRRVVTAARILRWGPYAPWARRALAALLAEHKRRPLGVIWAIHGDSSAHEVGFRGHRALGVPWVADFKDPWEIFHLGAAAQLQEVATRRRVRTSALLTETSAGQASRDSKTFSKRSEVVWSGYDAGLMERVPARRSSDKFSIVYVGHSGPQHDRMRLGRLLRDLRARAVKPFELHVYGHRWGNLEDALRYNGVLDISRSHGFLPQEDAFSVMKGADMLAVLPSTQLSAKGVLVGVKELEYLASGTPVWFVGAPLPEIASIIAGLPQVLLGDSDATSTEGLLAEMKAFDEGRAGRRTKPNAPGVMVWSWEGVGRQLSQLLIEVAASPSTGGWSVE